jgi:hypothetical protein
MVTHASSGSKASTTSASFFRKLSGMRSGK